MLHFVKFRTVYCTNTLILIHIYSNGKYVSAAHYNPIEKTILFAIDTKYDKGVYKNKIIGMNYLLNSKLIFPFKKEFHHDHIYNLYFKPSTELLLEILE